jgi:exonuclease SbcC
LRIARLSGLRAADLPPLDAALGPGLVAFVGSPEDAAEVRRALVWAAAVGDGSVVVEGEARAAAIEPLWTGAGALADALDAASRWLAGPSLDRVEAAHARLTGALPAAAPESAAQGEAEPRSLLKEALAELRVRERELRDLRAEWAEVTGDVEQATMEWLRERQDSETQLLAYRDRARELKARLAQIEAAGPDAPCPTCGRPLADHLKDVRVQLREEWESVVQDGRWWKRRREQLEGKPEHLRGLEGHGVRVGAAVESGAERVERVRARIRELEGALEPSAGAGEESPEGRALALLADELRAAARACVLREAGRLAERITAGRVLWIRASEHGPVAEGVFPGGVALARDRAALELAGRVAAARLARDAGAPLQAVIVGESLDALDAEDRLRAADVLAEAAEGLGQVVIVTGTDLVELRPEVFAQAFALRPRGGGGVAPLAVGVPELRLAC